MKKILALIIFLLATFFSFLVPPSISAAWIKYAHNPILEPGPSGSWDNQGVFAPSVIFQGSTYKMWYAGYGGSATNPVGRIGYATSSNGLDWIKHTSYVLDIIPADPWERHIGEPNVLFDENELIYKYKMWFTATGAGTDTYRIGYAISRDGIAWTRQSGYILTGDSGKWDSNGVAAPNVLKTTGEYQMWFMSYVGGQWQIGYATSEKGIMWGKYVYNPVLLPSESESPTVAGPEVLFENGEYKIFYNAKHPPSIINMATSPNGIAWTRSQDNPLLQIGGNGTFDNFQIAAPCVRKNNGIYQMWYSSKGGGYPYWRLGYASTEEVAPTFTPTPTIAPTSTPTPTATPIPTSTPTSTPIPTPTSGPRKVVFLPGLGSSWNADAILNCKTDGTGNWTLAPFAAGTYTPLLSALGENGKPFYYDWRKNVRDQTAPLKDFINSLANDGEKVNLVGHSLGGLVSRAYLENRGTDSKLEKLLTVGSPHQGAPQAYPAWSAGEIWEENLITRIATTILLKRCAVRREEPRETLRRIVPSMQNLLPIFDYLRDTKTKILKPVDQMDAKNNWLPTDFPPFHGVLVGTLSGNGFPTLKTIKVKEPNKKDVRSGNWDDGKPAGKETVMEGDGSVLLFSSQLPEAERRIINQSHGGLVASSEGIAQILDFLGIGGTGATALQTAFSEPRSALVIIGYPSGFWVMDSAGKLTKDQEGMISINNPGKGHYRFGLIPKSEKTLFIIAQFLEDGRVLWKEYNFKNRLPKFGKINFDPGNPQEDALRLGL